MPTPTQEEVQFKEYLELLISAQLPGMDPVDREDFLERLQDTQNKYMAARIEADGKDLTAAERERNERIFKALAAGMTGVTKGALSAAQAFQNGDNISGAAAVMDICASIIPLFDLAGPEGTAIGMLIGSVFSCVGQILSFFAPKQPSLEEKIQKMLDHAQGEAQIQALAAVGHTIHIYTRTLKAKSTGTHKFEEEVVAGTVALTKDAVTVTSTSASFKALQVDQWLVFDSDASREPYRISEIASDTALKLGSPYRGASTPATSVKQFVRKVIKRSVDEILEMPLETEEQADLFQKEMISLEVSLLLNQARTNVAAFNLWTVAGYLERLENQGKEGWPEVLGTWCNMYNDLLNANVMLKSLAHPLKIQEQRAKVEPGKSSLPEATRIECHRLLIELDGLTDALSDAWTSDGQEALKTLKAVTPAARNRGLYLSKEYWQGGNGYILNVAVAPPSDEGSLPWSYQKNTGWLMGPRGGSFSSVVPKDEGNSFTPRYQLFLLEDNDPRITRYSVDSVTGALTNGLTLMQNGTAYPDWEGNGSSRRFEACVDAWVVADPQVANPRLPPIGVRIYTAHNVNTWCYVNIHTVGPDGKVWRLNWEPHSSPGLRDIRALFRPLTTLPDDPDRGALPQGQYDIIYGGYSNNPKIWVALLNNWDTEVPSPWENYNGIEVDSNYLWVFGSHGLACATHASVIRCKKGEIPHPNWMTFTYGWADGFDVSSLSPCADGILAWRSVRAGGEVHTVSFEINLQERRLSLDGRLWNRGARAEQVMKMPIPCWPTLESLRKALGS